MQTLSVRNSIETTLKYNHPQNPKPEWSISEAFYYLNYIRNANGYDGFELDEETSENLDRAYRCARMFTTSTKPYTAGDINGLYLF